MGADDRGGRRLTAETHMPLPSAETSSFPRFAWLGVSLVGLVAVVFAATRSADDGLGIAQDTFAVD
ncbi:MAG: hypothetical protein IH849_09205 [Acidobacteria bacterium]|nr:hypothetical protein [Acidobacteriota bacterium]